jgi:hypothetical protein
MRTIPRAIMTCTWFLRVCRRMVGSLLEGVIGFGPQAIWCRPPDRRVLSCAAGISGGHACRPSRLIQDVRRERMLIKFGGVQPNRSVPAEGLNNHNGTPVGYPRPDPDLRGQPHGQRWLAAKSGVAVVIVGAQPGVKSPTAFGVAGEPGAAPVGAQ